jgi:hypothetical protein
MLGSVDLENKKMSANRSRLNSGRGRIMQQAKPNLSFWQIWNMCFGFLGIQFGFALQNGNVSRIFQTLGASIDEIPILWIAGPLTGLLVQPIIGYFSDRTWNKLGRRRPYFFYGAVLTTVALFFMPNSPTLWMAAGMLWILDASINITMERCKAFLSALALWSLRRCHTFFQTGLMWPTPLQPVKSRTQSNIRFTPVV